MTYLVKNEDVHGNRKNYGKKFKCFRLRHLLSNKHLSFDDNFIACLEDNENKLN